MNKVICGFMCVCFFIIAVFGPKEEQATATIISNIWLAALVLLPNKKTDK